jgi:hypothetical protein
MTAASWPFNAMTTPPDGVTREVLEGTGIKIHADELTGVYKNMKLGVVTRKAS